MIAFRSNVSLGLLGKLPCKKHAVQMGIARIAQIAQMPKLTSFLFPGVSLTVITPFLKYMLYSAASKHVSIHYVCTSAL